MESDLPEDIRDDALRVFRGAIADKATIQDAINKVSLLLLAVLVWLLLLPTLSRWTKKRSVRWRQGSRASGSRQARHVLHICHVEEKAMKYWFFVNVLNTTKKYHKVTGHKLVSTVTNAFAICLQALFPRFCLLLNWNNKHEQLLLFLCKPTF